MDPITPNSILLLPAIFVFFGLFTYGIAFANGLRDHTFPLYRWFGVVLAVVAVVVGGLTLGKMYDSNAAFYQSLFTSRKVVFAHYVAVALPLVVLATMIGMELWSRNFVRNME